MQRFKNKSDRRRAIVAPVRGVGSLSPHRANSLRSRLSPRSTEGPAESSDSDTGLDSTAVLRFDGMDASFNNSLSRAGSFSFRPQVRSTAVGLGPLLEGAVMEGRMRANAVVLSPTTIVGDAPTNDSMIPRRRASWRMGAFRPVDPSNSLPRWRQAQTVLQAVLDGLVLVCPQSYTSIPSLKLRTNVTIPLNPRALGAEVRMDAPADHWSDSVAAATSMMPRGSVGVVYTAADCKDGLVDWVVVRRKQLYHPEGREVAPLAQGGKWKGCDPFLIMGSTSSPLSALKVRREVEDEAIRNRNEDEATERRKAERSTRKQILLANVSQAFRPPQDLQESTLEEPVESVNASVAFTPTPPARQLTTRGRRGSYAVAASDDVVRSVQSPEFFIACLCKELRAGSKSMEALSLCMHGDPLTLDMLISIFSALDDRIGSPIQKLGLTHARIESAGLLAFAEWALCYPSSLVVRPLAALDGQATIHSSLHTLDLSGNNLVQSDLPVLEAALLPFTGLRSLSLRNNPTLRYTSPGSYGDGDAHLGFAALTPLLWSLEGRIEHLDLGLCSLNNPAVIKLCSFLQEEARSSKQSHLVSKRSRCDVDGYIPGRLSRINIDGATISHQVATYVLQTVAGNMAILEFGVGMVIACSSQAYVSQLEAALSNNLMAATERAEKHRSPSFRLSPKSSFKGAPESVDLILYPHPPLTSLLSLSASRRHRLLVKLRARRHSPTVVGILEQLGSKSIAAAGMGVHAETTEEDSGEEDDVSSEGCWEGELSPGYAAYTSNATVPLIPLPSSTPKLQRAVDALVQLNPIEPPSSQQ